MRARLGRRVGILTALFLCLASGVAVRAQPAADDMPVFRELTRIATDPSLPMDERLSAIGGLGKAAHPRVAATLVALTRDPEVAIRQAAASALGWRGNRPAVGPLLARATDAAEATPVRAAAITALGRIGDATAVAPIETLARDAAAAVRREALLALVDSALAQGADRVLPAIALLQDLEQDGYTRARAAALLGAAGDPRGVAPLLAALGDPRPPAGYDQLPSPAGLTGTAEVMAERLRSLHNVRARAALALGRLGAREAVETLIQTLSDPDYQVRIQSAAALGLLRAAAAVPGLTSAMKETDPRIRANAVRALGMIGDRAAGPTLLAALADENPEVRERAAVALGRLGDPTARSALEKVISRDPAPPVRRAAHQALERLRQSPGGAGQ